MSHIKVTEDNQGIVSLFKTFPKTAQAMSFLAETLLRGESPLPRWFREYIASMVSKWNTTEFCGRSHMASAIANKNLERTDNAVTTKEELHNIVIDSTKYTQLLGLAKKITGNEYTGAYIDDLKEQGIVTEEEIHDTVAVASAFCMYNRYVSGLGVNSPEIAKEGYKGIGEMLAGRGYIPQEELQTA